jgi:hypothetical protein
MGVKIFARRMPSQAGAWRSWLELAGFEKIDIGIVAREEDPRHFQTLLAGAEK